MHNPYAQLRQSLGRPLFIPFTVLGDPEPATSKKIVQALIDSGADALELGLPFSDPPADGPVIQAADKRALDAGVTIDDCFAILNDVKSQIPVGLLVYYNLVLQRGIDQFYSDCKEAGVTSVLVADLPLEHSEEVVAAAKKNDLLPVFMVSDLTSEERLKEICKVAEGYLYVVSYVGVTGKNDAVSIEHIQPLINRLRKHTDLPLCIGFGISTPEHVQAVKAAGADGVIVGSRIVKEVPDVKKIVSICKMLNDSSS